MYKTPLTRKEAQAELASLKGKWTEREQAVAEVRLDYTLFSDDSVVRLEISDSTIPERFRHLATDENGYRILWPTHEVRSAVRADQPHPIVELGFATNCKELSITTDLSFEKQRADLNLARCKALNRPPQAIELYLGDSLHIVDWPAQPWDFVGKLRIHRSEPQVFFKLVECLPALTEIETFVQSFQDWDRYASFINRLQLKKVLVSSDEDLTRETVEKFERCLSSCELTYHYREIPSSAFAPYKCVTYEKHQWNELTTSDR